ncbi:MAG: UvrD-helicase domain-containing protein [Chloroflexi bacterium]|nr:UvrD-helicase domain-containing protein [Chloroflexota bacterium]
MEDLNEPQRQGVQSVEGPVLILAGPGSGKTRVITHRVAYLIQECGIHPYQIMAVTFTNKAANEMRHRLEQLLPRSTRHLTIGTFHAICARLLRREAEAMGVDPHFVIYDEDDQLGLIKRALHDLNLSEKSYQPRALLSQISAAKSELRSPAVYAEYAGSYWEEVVLRVYRRYQELLLGNRAMDFDDLLLNAVHLFRTRPEVLDKYQERYLHVLVDEFQDTNMAQYAFVRLLADKHRNLCVVGDEDQSVYGWRQADIRNILNFERDFPDTKVIYLEQNYRSTKTILGAAQHVIQANTLRKEKRLWTANDEGVPITVFEAYNEDEEASYVVSEVQRLMSRGAAQPKDCVVMYRANAQSRVLENAFVRARVPYRLVGTRFYERKEVKDMLAYLRLLVNPYDGVSLFRIINVPGRGLGAKTIEELARWAHGLGMAPYDALLTLRDEGPDAARSPFTTRGRQALLSFITMMEELREASRQLLLAELIDLVIKRTGYADYLRDNTEEGEDRLANVQELASVAEDYLELEPEVALSNFLEEAALFSDNDEYDETANAVTLITLHAAKGLEFPVVFIVGLEEGICPHIRSFDDPERMEEERRLCYVGMTRAIHHLYMVYAFKRTLYGKPMINPPSRFFRDIPRSLMNDPPARFTEAAASEVATPKGRGGWVTEPAAAKVNEAPSPPAAALQPGDRVRHAKFGEGVVVEMNGEEEAVVLFRGSAGTKRLSLAYAPLVKL